MQQLHSGQFVDYIKSIARFRRNRGALIPCIVFLGVVAHTEARADIPLWAYEHHDLHAPWSISPMLGLRGGVRSDADTLVKPTFDLDLSLRWRYGNPPDNKDGAPSPKLVAFGLSVASSTFETIEPSVFLGGHLLPWADTVWSQRLYWNLRADVGFGYRFGFDAASSTPVAYTKIAVGVLFGQDEHYVVGAGETSYKLSRDVFCGEFDIVVKVQHSLDGDWQVGAGVEFDPLRVFGNVNRLLWQSATFLDRSC